MASAICGSACFTAAATFASSAFIIRTISSDDFRSRSADAGFDCSVASRLSLGCALVRFLKEQPRDLMLRKRHRETPALFL